MPTHHLSSSIAFLIKSLQPSKTKPTSPKREDHTQERKKKEKRRKKGKEKEEEDDREGEREISGEREKPRERASERRRWSPSSVRARHQPRRAAAVEPPWSPTEKGRRSKRKRRGRRGDSPRKLNLTFGSGNFFSLVGLKSRVLGELGVFDFGLEFVVLAVVR